MSLEDDAAQILDAADREILLTVREFCDLFERNHRHCLRRCKAGAVPNATLIAGRWYLYVPKRAVEAAKNRAA